MFDTVWSSLAALAILAGIMAGLAFIALLILLWVRFPDEDGLAEADWFEELPARSRHSL